jgi:hypothetical protein
MIDLDVIKKPCYVIDRGSLRMTCCGCPSQWDAMTKDGDSVFIRLRHGSFRLEVNGKTVAAGQPEGYDGVMSTQEMIDYLESSCLFKFE